MAVVEKKVEGHSIGREKRAVGEEMVEQNIHLTIANGHHLLEVLEEVQRSNTVEHMRRRSGSIVQRAPKRILSREPYVYGNTERPTQHIR